MASLGGLLLGLPFDSEDLGWYFSPKRRVVSELLGVKT
jgi:hypothetical protein